MKNLKHVEEKLPKIEEMGGVIELGCVGVDSGQLIVTDPCYIDELWEKEDFERDELGIPQDEKRKDYFNYSRVGCHNQNRKNSGGELFGLNRTKERDGDKEYDYSHISLGTTFSTGYGDGCYPVYGKSNDDGRIMGVFIDFGMNEEEGFLDIDEVEEMLS